jgi:hypothetical protein
LFTIKSAPSEMAFGRLDSRLLTVLVQGSNMLEIDVPIVASAVRRVEGHDTVAWDFSDARLQGRPGNLARSSEQTIRAAS